MFLLKKKKIQRLRQKKEEDPLKMEIVDIDNVKYLIKKKFTLSSIKNEEILSEYKGLWGADTIIKSEPHDLFMFAQKISDVDFEEIID